MHADRMCIGRGYTWSHARTYTSVIQTKHLQRCPRCHVIRRGVRPALSRKGMARPRRSQGHFEYPREVKKNSLGTRRTRPSRESHDPPVILLFLSSFLAEKITADLTNRPRLRASAATFSYAPIVFFSYLACRIARGHESRRATRRGVTLFVQLSTKLVTRPTETDRPIRLSVRPSVVVDAADHQLSGLPLVPLPPSPCHRWHSLRERRVVTWPAAPSGSSGSCQRGAHRAGRRRNDAEPPVASARDAAFFLSFFFPFSFWMKIRRNSSRFLVRYKWDYKLRN